MAANGSLLSSRSGTPRPNNVGSGNGFYSEPRDGLLAVLPHLLTVCPEVTSSFLLCGNKAVHNAAAAHAYRKLDVEVAIAGTSAHDQSQDKAPRPCCPGHGMKTKLLAVLRNPPYAAHVRVLHFRHPCPAHTPSGVDEESKSFDRTEAWDIASSLIEHLSGIEELAWETGFGIGGSLWTAIASLPNLDRLYLHSPPPHPARVDSVATYPRLTPDLQQVVPPGFEAPVLESSDTRQARAVGHGGLALGVAWEDLEVLSIEGLSVHGARSLASHLQILAKQHDYLHPPRLHTLSIATHFADLRLCESIGQFGALRSLKHLTLATTGTKLNAECLKVIFEDCTALESLHLNDVEGRLDKNTWSMIDSWPSSFNSLEIDIAETGAHHSWVLKHLSSIQSVPMSQLRRFAVRRILHPVATLPWAPLTVAVPQTLPTHRLERLPTELLQLISDEGDLLEELCLDWWEMTTSDLEAILLGSPCLRKLQITVMAPLMEIISMSTAFGNVPDLAELSLTSDPIYTTNAAIKLKASKAKKEPLGLPPFLEQKVAEADPAMIEHRDLRKFVRRLPSFRVLRWIGRDGKGEWRFTASKKTTLIPILFTHSAVLTRQIWDDCQRTPPSFEFEDDEGASAIAVALDPPASPDRTSSSDLPALSRTTTGSSMSLLTTTPPTLSIPMRRSSSATTNGSAGLGIDWEGTSPPKSPVVISTSPRKSSIPPPVRRESDPKPVSERRESRGSRGGSGRRSSKPPARNESVGPSGRGSVSSPTKEPRHIPGAPARRSSSSAGVGVSAPSSPVKKTFRKEVSADGWTTIEKVPKKK